MRSLLIAALFFPSPWARTAGCGSARSGSTPTNDSAVFAQPVRSLSGRDVFIDKTAWLTERDVKAFYPYRAADGSYAALLLLDDHGRTILDTLSVEHRLSFLFVFVNGRPLTELQVDRRVSDRTIYLPSGLTETDIKLMNKDWKLLSRRK